MRLILKAKLISTSQIKKAFLAKKEKNRVEFDANLEDLYNGAYGFDNYKNAKKGCCDKRSLENIYDCYQNIAGEKYYTPWLCAPKGEKIKLDVKMYGNGQTNEIHDSDVSISPNILSKDVSLVEITCNSYLKESKKIEFIVNSKVAGAINFYPNVIKQFIVRVCYVGKDLENLQLLKDQWSLSLIKEWLYEAFHQVAIEVNCQETGLILSSNIVQFLKNKDVFIDNDNVKRDDGSRKLLMQCLKNELALKEGIIQNSGEIILFLTPFQCKVEEYGNVLYNNGISSSKDGISLMFLGNLCKPKEEIPHEIMHCLGLEHIFSSESKILYNKGRTKNFMDYDNSKKITYKWQWDIMRKSSFLK